MKKIKIYQVDAFADRLFSGNPAAVCMLRDWMDDDILQSIGTENNLPETAFVVPGQDRFGIRWFTPTVEVDLCGHATLAAAYVLFRFLGYGEPEIIFQSPRSGELKVTQQEDILFLDFPSDTLKAYKDPDSIGKCLNIQPLKVLRGKTDFLAVLGREADVRNLEPDLQEIAKLDARGLIVTARGEKVDFVSRFFAPQSGIDEDPVTGSAHTSLIPFWSAELGKKEMRAKQLSRRGGNLICIDRNERCLIGGRARLYMSGEITLD